MTDTDYFQHKIDRSCKNRNIRGNKKHCIAMPDGSCVCGCVCFFFLKKKYIVVR
uniref:Uncharacterized protein n=1 Tax=Rhizophora mucronata TaxID=61149 RepID=A0A2P2QD26_RHIMU